MELYHVLNRGTDGRTIVMNDRDRLRFVKDLYDMNNDLPVLNMHRSKVFDVGRQVKKDIREKLVLIHGWCLMNNHYHLLLSEERDGGMSKFLKKLNMGYSKYFNERYTRVGTLFQGKTKKVLIDDEAQYLYILHYTHLNPLDYLPGAKDWRIRSKGTITSAERALKHLHSYRWSSYHDYAGTPLFPGITTTSFMDENGSVIKELKRYLASAQKSSLPASLE